MPQFGIGNPRNDYGLGFYCTQEIELAREWACSEENDGFVNEYRVDPNGLSVMNLNAGSYNILNWLAILLENRIFDLSSPIASRARQYLLDNFLPDYKNYDVIIGCRADDSYFSFSRAFLSNSITLAQLGKAMHLGKLGEQVVFRSRAAFEHISFVEATPVSSAIYHPKRLSRDRDARMDFQMMLSEIPEDVSVFVSDIIKNKWKNDDARLK